MKYYKKPKIKVIELEKNNTLTEVALDLFSDIDISVEEDDEEE